jgi:hypothetical protein
MTLSGNYLHIRKDTGAIFYVGLGNEKRAKSKGNRNIHWHRIVSKHGYSIKYLGDRSLDDAKAMEVSLIKIFGREHLGDGTLVNMTDGGDGVINLSPDAKIKHKEAMLKAAKNPETIAKRSAATKGRFDNDPAFVERHKNGYKSEKTLQLLSANAKNNWDRPEYKALLKEHISKSWTNEEIRKTRCEKMSKAIAQAYAVAQLLGIKRREVTRELRLANLHLIDKELL